MPRVPDESSVIGDQPAKDLSKPLCYIPVFHDAQGESASRVEQPPGKVEQGDVRIVGSV